MRVGIAGGGIAGLAAAWLLDGVHEVVLLEERHSLGGNLRSVRLPGNRGSVETVELGVQGVPLRAAPWTAAVASAVGLRREDWTALPSGRAIQRDDAAAQPLPAGGTGAAGQIAPEDARQAFAVLGSQAADWARQDVAWEVPLAERTAAWQLPALVKDEVVHALAASLFGCTVREAGQLSARAVGAFYADPDEDGDADLFRLREGMQSLAWRLAADTSTTTLLPGRALRELQRGRHGLQMLDSSGARHPVDAVVLSLPAYAARSAIGALPHAARLDSALSAFTYRDLVYGVHRDTRYLPTERQHWTPSRITVHGPWAESTSWTRRPGGEDVFVSQLTHRDELPRVLLETAVFRTLQPTPPMFAAQNELDTLQGLEDLYFAGHLTARVNDLESALSSAASVCRRLTPGLPRLRSLAARTRKDTS